MDVRGNSQPINKIAADAIAVAVFKGEKADDGVLKTLDKAVNRAITSIIKSEEFSGKEGETAYFHLTVSELQARRLLLIGCGERKDYGAATDLANGWHGGKVSPKQGGEDDCHRSARGR